MFKSLIGRGLWTLLFLGGFFVNPSISTARDGSAGDAAVDFNRDIRSILSDNCFLCHGPDESSREAGLRLDDRAEAIDFAAITPGSAEESSIIDRLTSTDPDVVMPPPHTGKTITAEQVDLFRRWIDDGASYDAHWAFVPPVRPDVPVVDEPSAQIRGDVDRFVAAKLKRKGWEATDLADPATRLRRLSLDLTGLPPDLQTLDQLHAAAAAGQTESFLTAQTNRLIDSPHFGEWWAQWWLDAARYADSSGYEKDMSRQVWFYRDYVIDAMSSDKPYDRFLIEQIAGDLLPGATQDQKVATGFLRNSMTNEEGGANPEQFRVEGMFDRMDAIGKAMLGLTTQCAQCHTHKYDPISHHEYYSMFAALNDFHEASITVYTPEQREQRDAVLARVADLENSVADSVPDWRAKVSAWAAQVNASMPHWQTITPTEVPFQGEKYNVLDDGSVVSESYAPTKTSNEFSAEVDLGTITAVRLDALTHPQLPRGGPGRSVEGTGALTEFYIKIDPAPRDDGTDPAEFRVKFVRAIADVNPPRARLPMYNREKNAESDMRVTGPIEFAIDGDGQTAWTTAIGPGRQNVDRHAVFFPESPIVVDGPAKLTYVLEMKHGGYNSDDNQNFLIGRYRVSITDAESLPEVAVETTAEPLLATSPDTWSDADWTAARSAWIAATQPVEGLREDIELAWQQFPQTTTQLVAQSLGQTRETFVYVRGDFLSPSDPVAPDAPSFLHKMEPPSQDVPDRLRFARWIASEQSPTTARVIVNRIWQRYFGRGLVSTAEDFGYQSTPPSHPALLDYLATELMEHDWSLKHVHRLIVNSAAYHRDSTAPAASWERDPDNEFLARGPRHRLEAEAVRDLALSVSGLLRDDVGGRSIYPPAPAFLFLPPTSYGPKPWPTETNGDQYRRSLYVQKYRSVPYPPLQVFDAPKGDAACVRRTESNTPLQALVMLNETQFVEAARAMAPRVLRAADTDSERIAAAFELCTARTPTADETSILTDLLDDRREHYAEHLDDAAAVIGLPPVMCRQMTGYDVDELAAWMMVTRTVLNLDETMTKS